MIKRYFVDLLFPVMSLAMSADLLYLKYLGVWYDPIKFIEVSEIILYYALAGASLVRIGYIAGQISKIQKRD